MDYPDLNADGDELERWGLEHGLLRLVTMTGRCGDECTCADEYGVDFPSTCNRFTPLLLGDK